MTVLLLIAAAPIAVDDIHEHPGATPGWSPLAEVGPAVTSHEFRTGLGWSA